MDLHDDVAVDAEGGDVHRPDLLLFLGRQLAEVDEVLLAQRKASAHARKDRARKHEKHDTSEVRQSTLCVIFQVSGEMQKRTLTAGR